MLPYLWLVYAAFYAVYPFVFGPGPLGWAPHLAGLLAFLALYLIGFRASGERRLFFVAALTVLGVVSAWFNPGGLVFFIYASSLVGGAVTGWPIGLWIGGVTLVGVVTAASIDGFQWMMLATVAVFTPLIGFVNVQAAAARRRDASLRMAQEEIARLAVVSERHRIAADLHDVLGHTLSVVVLKAELAARLAEADPAAARAEMLEVERVAREALASTRKVVTGMAMTTLADELLRARTVLEGAGVVVTTDPADGRPDLSALAEPVQHALAMVLREAVTNVLRHAKAARCHVAVAVASGTARLEVADDGRGADLREGNGMRGMRARLQEVGGDLQVAAGAGVRVTATVPARGVDA